MFVRVCREETVFNTISNLLQGPRDHLRKTLLIAYFVHQFVGGNEESVNTTEVELEDRAWRVVSWFIVCRR